jgi:hypothetical protein
MDEGVPRAIPADRVAKLMMEDYGESFRNDVAYFRENDPEYKFTA